MLEYDQFKHSERKRISDLRKRKKESMSENDLLKQKHRESIRISVFRKKKKETISESDLLKQQHSERNRKNIYRKRNKESMSENTQFKHSERKRISDLRKRKRESISEYDQFKHSERKRNSDFRKKKKETILEYDQFKHSERKRISDLRKRKKESISEYDQFKHSERKRISDLRKRKRESISEYDQIKHSERKRISDLRKKKKETILEYDQFKHSERRRISDLRKKKKETILEYDQFKHSERRRISDLRKKKLETMSENEQWNQQLNERKRKINERKKYTKNISNHDNQIEKEHERLRVSNYRKQKRLNFSKAALQRSLIEAKKRKLKHRHPTNIYLSIKNFQTHIRQYAEYICTCCNRLLYRKSVVLVTPDSFKTLNAGLRKKCVTQRKSKMGFEWICNTCSSYLKKGKMPPQANANCLEIPTVPDELKSLSSLEVRLLSQRYPFMKILALPKGKQCGLKGSVVNIPVNEKEVCSTLPRTPQRAGLIPLRLKRRIKNKGHVKFQFIRPDKIRDALHWLQLNNPLYQHIKENSNWENDCIHENEETWAELTADSSDTNSANLDKTANQRNSDTSNTASSQVEKTQSVDSSNTNSANVDKSANQRNSDASNTASSQVEKTQSVDSSNTNSANVDKSANQRNSDASNTASSQVEKTQSVDSSNANSANVDKTANQRNSDASNTASSQVEKTESQSVINTEEFDDDYSDDPSSKLRGLHYETCVQTVDPTVDVDKILNIAPGENKRPIHILMDESFEEMAFPHLLPTGKFGWKYERPLKLTPKKYFQRRLLDADPRFAQDIEYLFVAQTVVEIKQIQDSMSIALKKAYHASPAGEALTAGVVRDSNSLKQFILKDQAYRYLQPIRGSPPYWQRVQYKLLAAIKQYGIFTWFFTLSAADLRWHDTIQEIAAQQGETISDEEIDVLTWEDKCKRLRSNPVSAARHFQYRLDCFMRDLILAKSEPLGHVVHYFYRIEFQVRGSPHAHGVLWIKDAPDPEKDRPEVICKFVDRYVQCSLPSPEEDPELHSLVNNLQRHTHSHSCRKTGKLCRFNFPKPVSKETLVSKLPVSDNLSPQTLIEIRKQSQDTLSVVKTYVNNTTDVEEMSLDNVLENCSLTSNQYHEALRNASKTTTLFLHRNPSAVMLNNYNPWLLRAWQANLDVQFVCNAYACIQYIVSYITKEEREMGTLLQAVAKESRDEEIKEQMKRCGKSFLNSRTITAQESAYRILGMPLYKSDSQIVWIPTGLPHQRISVIRPLSYLGNLEDDDEDIFVSGIGDKYSKRPSSLESWCLAAFAAWYKTANKSVYTADFQSSVLDEKQSIMSTNHEQATSLVDNVPEKLQIELPSSSCIMTKRKKQAGIRYHKWPISKQPESFYYSELYLFVPWRNEETDLLNGHSCYMDSHSSFAETIKRNRSPFEKHAELIDAAVQDIEENGAPTNAWDELAPETEQEQCDAEEEGAEPDPEHSILHPENDVSNPDIVLPPTHQDFQVGLAIERIPDIWPHDKYNKHIQSLNSEQYQVFQIILSWCRSYMQPHNPNEKLTSLHLFISGGAGTGKSHLIKALYQTIQITLRKEGETPDLPKVLLLAPTGPAAFNIQGMTIHSALLISVLHSKGKNKSHMSLSDDKRNTLRSKLSSLKFIIIDEISMVSSNLFLQMHNRLDELFGGSDIFGGISILAFGDMYQLSPVIQPYVFEEPSDKFAKLAVSLWSYFTIIPLSQIMRQQGDIPFAQMLSRIRQGNQTEEDIDILQTRTVTDVDSIPLETLRVFATNRDVDEYNQNKLHQLPSRVIIMQATDKIPQSMKKLTLSDDPRYTGGLSTTVQLAVGARVMLIRNIDVSDGLTNGTQGTVIDFIFNKNNSTTLAVLVKFDHSDVGKNAKLASKFDLSKYHKNDVVPITQIEVTFSPSTANATVSRRQFPLKLCWACTIHKVQGATLDSIAVSFERTFKAGMAYVALSRVKTLTGLYITQFNPKKIKVSEMVKTEMDRMQQHAVSLNPYANFINQGHRSITVALLNARSAKLHFKDILAHPLLANADILCLTETHYHEDNLHMFQRNGWNLEVLPCIPHTLCHGLAIYTRSSLCGVASRSSFLGHSELLQVSISSSIGLRSIMLLYRSPSAKTDDFIESLTHLISSEQPDIVLGDMNLDIVSSFYKTLEKQMNGYVQLIQKPTHVSGSVLDLVFINKKHQRPMDTIFPTYFSDHSLVALHYFPRD